MRRQKEWIRKMSIESCRRGHFDEVFSIVGSGDIEKELNIIPKVVH